jgi:norsolorinic acid ketoreductase
VAVETLSSQHGVSHLDIVIANAGISNYFGSALVTPPHEVIDHYRINVLGPLLLFQATAPLLLNAKRPTFVAMSSGAGSIDGIERLKIENTAYGASKAALNFVTRRIHAENEKIIAFPLNPGWLQTDVGPNHPIPTLKSLTKASIQLGNHAATSSGMSSAPISVEDGVQKVIEIIDNATRESTSGRFMSAQGGELPW